MTTPLHMAGVLQTKAYRILQARVNECLARHGLNHGQWVMLGIVADNAEGIRLNTTADIIGVKAPLVTAMAHELIALKYITRLTHEHDRRAKLLTATDEGRAVLVRVRRCLDELFEVLLNKITSKELETYQKVLTAIVQNNEKLDS